MSRIALPFSLQRMHRNRRRYLVAVGWVLVLDVISSANDIISLNLGQALHPLQIAFLRNVIAMLWMLPVMLPKKTLYFRVRRPGWHVLRAVIGALAVGGFTIGVIKVPLMKNTAVGFMEPLFFLPMGVLILKEKIDPPRLWCAIIGLFGIILMTYEELASYQFWVLLTVLSTFCYAALTCLGRIMFEEESAYTLIFYFALGVALLLMIPALFVWHSVDTRSWGWLGLLGFNSSFMQIAMFQLFRYADVSAVMPLRYVEILVTSLLGVMLFHQIPTLATWLGAGIIVGTACILTVYEQRKDRLVR